MADTMDLYNLSAYREIYKVELVKFDETFKMVISSQPI